MGSSAAIHCCANYARMPLAQKQASVTPRVTGIDDWAWRKGQR